MAKKKKTLGIKIKSRCKATPKSAHLSQAGHHQVHWRAEEGRSFALLLPGGVFEGHPHAFALAVSGEDFAPDPPLMLIEKPPKTSIRKYIFDNGDNCDEDDPLDDPPEIVIDS